MLRYLFVLATFQFYGLCQELKGQIEHVYINVDMVNTPLTIGYAPPAVFFPLYSMNTTVTESGSIRTPATPGMGLLGIQNYVFEQGKELYFQVQASYHSEGLPDGPSGDPASGFLFAGLALNNTLVGWLLTDTSEYALIQIKQYLYAIPIGQRQPNEMATYTVVVNRSSRKIRFNKNYINMLIAPGQCGIDDRFLVGNYAKEADWCEPVLNDASFEGGVRFLLLLGNFFGNYESVSPFCMNCVFDQCRESLSRAFGCHCQHPNSTFVSDNVFFNAQLDGIKIFSMERTERCPYEQRSSSTLRQWWQQKPVVKDGEEQAGSDQVEQIQ